MAKLSSYTFGTARFRSPGNIPTGHFHLDFAIHHGCDPTKIDLNSLEGYDPRVPLGLPLGKMVEVFGEEGGGKSSLAYRVVGQAQKLGYKCAWIDVEHSFSEDLARINGCDIDEIIYPNNNLCAEDVINLIIAMCREESVPMPQADGKIVKVSAPKVIIVDSIASMTPRARHDADADQLYVGLLARLMSDNLGPIAQAAEDSGVLIVWINQLREKIGTGPYSGGHTSPGGRAFKHFFSLRLKIRRDKSTDARIIRWDEDSGREVLIGAYSKVTIEKNRFAKPYFDDIKIPIYYEEYFPEIADVAFDAGRQIKLISVYKGEFRWRDVKIEGRKAFIDELKQKGLIDELIDEIKEKALELKTVIPPEITLYETARKKVEETDLEESGNDSNRNEESVPSDRKRKYSTGGKGVSKKSKG